MTCIFCTMTEFSAQNEHAYAIYDKHPVNPGHVLIIPKRHMSDYFELEPEEEACIWSLLRVMKSTVELKFKPDGWNIGINNGKSAGQTIFHLHVHLIPRYEGDVDMPEGGVRGVIPVRRDYRRSY